MGMTFSVVILCVFAVCSFQSLSVISVIDHI